MTLHLDATSLAILAVCIVAAMVISAEIGASLMRKRCCGGSKLANDAAAIARAKRQRKHRLYPPT